MDALAEIVQKEMTNVEAWAQRLGSMCWQLRGKGCGLRGLREGGGGGGEAVDQMDHGGEAGAEKRWWCHLIWPRCQVKGSGNDVDRKEEADGRAGTHSNQKVSRYHHNSNHREWE